MLGPQNMHLDVKDDKLQKIKDGHFDERFVTIEIPPDLVDQKKFASLESLLDYLKNYSTVDYF